MCSARNPQLRAQVPFTAPRLTQLQLALCTPRPAAAGAVHASPSCSWRCARPVQLQLALCTPRPAAAGAVHARTCAAGLI
eukprot:955882-Rhodomonas_salina.1